MPAHLGGENEDPSFTEQGSVTETYSVQAFLKFPVPAMLQYGPKQQSRRFGCLLWKMVIVCSKKGSRRNAFNH